MTPSSQHQERIDVLKVQLNIVIDIYKHHLELFLKWMTLYFAVVSAITVYIFNEAIKPSARRLLPILIGIGSLIVALGCFSMQIWLKKLEKELQRISKELEISPSPELLGKRMTMFMLIVSLGFSVANLLFSFFWKNFIK